MFDSLSEKFSDAFQSLRGKKHISEENINETLQVVRQAMLEADVSFKVVKAFIEEVKGKALGEKVLRGIDPGEQFIKIMHDELTQLMGGKENEWVVPQHFFGVMVVGLNGAGKTTFSGKLARYLKEKKSKKILLVPADPYRPAAKDQLQVLAKSIGVECFDSPLAEGSLAIIKKGLEFAKSGGFQGVIFDTAGRLHVDEELMAELASLRHYLDTQNLKPEVMMVADAMTGQEAAQVAQSFHERVQLTGVVLSKMDSDARGGAALSIKHVTGVPLRFLSTGEKMQDLDLFYPDRMAQRILDMGDVLTLVEKTQEIISEQEAEKLVNKMENNRFTMEDFLQQMESISKMGSLASILKMIPGMGDLTRKVGDLSGAEGELKRHKVIISSMTIQERRNDSLLNESRKRRIAKGAGVKVEEVSQFLNKFRQMKGMMSSMMGMMKGGGLGNLFGGGAGFPGAGGGNRPSKKKMKGKKPGGKGPWGRSYF